MMKGRLLILLLLLISTGPLQADSSIYLGFGWQYWSQVYSADNESRALSISALSMDITGFYGGKFGFLTMLNFLFLPLDINWGEQVLGGGNYSNQLALELIFGLGYRRRLSERVTAMLGGGVHASHVSLIPRFSSYPSFGMDVGLGFGATLTLNYALLKGLFLFISNKLSYDFVGFSIAEHETTLSRGFSMGAGAGLGVVF